MRGIALINSLDQISIYLELRGVNVYSEGAGQDVLVTLLRFRVLTFSGLGLRPYSSDAADPLSSLRRVATLR